MLYFYLVTLFIPMKITSVKVHAPQPCCLIHQSLLILQDINSKISSLSFDIISSLPLFFLSFPHPQALSNPFL